MKKPSTVKQFFLNLLCFFLAFLAFCFNLSFAQTLNVEKVSVSGCYFSDGSSKATVSVQVGWTGLVSGNNITVILGSQTKTIQAERSTAISKIISPQVVAFEVPSNSAIGTVTATVLALSANGSYTAPAPCVPLQCNAGELGGQAYFDFNNDGTKQAIENQGQAGITVSVTDKNGTLYTTTTDNLGNWKLIIPTANYCVRVEYSNIPPHLRNSSTITGGTTTQFYNSPTCNADMGVLSVADFSQANPKVYVPIWANGNPAHASNATKYAISTFDYTQIGNPLGGGEISNSGIIPYSYGGTLWGVAWDRANKKLYASAMLRRHAGLGVAGLAGIYQYDPVANTYTNFDLAATTSQNFGTISSNTIRGLGPALSYNYDVEAHSKVGKIGIGAISINETGTLMYVMNLFQKQIVVVNLPNMSLNKVINVPDPGCTGGSYRPWSCSYYKGKLYIGVVCDAQSSANRSNLNATIYEVNPISNASTQILQFPLTYPKGFPNSNVTTGWHTWSDDYNVMVNSNTATGVGANGGYPTPILVDIDFDIDGAMVIALNDRTASQIGYRNYLPDPTLTDTRLWSANSGGDILRAYYSNGVYALENGGKAGASSGANPTNNEGPGFGEFFNDNFVNWHTETMSGGLAIKPGSGEVAGIFMDPNNTTSQVFAGGVKYLNSNNGAYVRAYNIYGGSPTTLNTFGKSNGLGDMVFAADNPNFSQIGNRVWQDDDGDGVQDPCEPGIVGITMKLYDAIGNLVGTTTTNSSGNYYFGNGVNGVNLVPGATYYVTAGEAQYTATNGLVVGNNKYGELTLPVTGEGTVTTNNDNNGIIAPNAGVTAGFAGIPFAQITAPANNTVNHTIDFGFTYGSVGNYVWNDTNRDGLQNEPASNGINGVTVELYRETTPGNFTLVGTTTTVNDGSGNAGYYNFNVFTSGNYQVKFPNTVATNILTIQTLTNGTDGNSDANPLNGNSPIIVMNVTGTGVAKNNSTIDAGYTTPVASLGNFVWNDTDRDGIQDAGEAGVSGVKVYLLNSTGTKIDSTTTNASGFYQFTNLTPGTYGVQFNLSTLPAGFVVSSANQGSDDTIDSDANTTTGIVPNVTLVAGENNPTLDMGINQPPASLGNFVWNDTDRDGIQDATETGVSGVKVYLLNSTGTKIDSTTTNGVGFYQFANLTPGTYGVQFNLSTLPAGYIVSPANQGSDDTIDSDANTTTGIVPNVILVAGENNPTLDMGINQPPASLGNFVWNDANRDGTQDAGEVGVTVVKVYLLNSTGTKIDSTTTNSVGFYQFINLTPGTYGVQFNLSTLPSGFVVSSINQGGDNTKDSDANTTTGVVANVMLAAGHNNLTLDMGINQPPMPPPPCVKPVVNYDWQYNGNCLTYDFNTTSWIPTGWITSFLWDFGNGTTSTQSNPLATFPVAGTYNVKLVVTSNLGCKDSITFPVNVINKCTSTGNGTGSTNGGGNGSPAPCSASWWSQPATNTCDSTLRFIVSSKTAGATYAWSFGDGTIGNGDSAIHKYLADGSYLIKLVVTNGTCKDSVAYNVTISNCSVTSGGGGGIESKSLGNIISQRLYGNAINNISQEIPKATQNFTKSTVVVNGPSDLRLIDLSPLSVLGTNMSLISTPTDLVNFTNAVEVLSVDYNSNSTTKAVVFATRTIGNVYNHTKPICDRLKGAELLDVRTINVNGYHIMACKLRQRTGELEYSINLSAGIKVGRSSISLQSNWFTNSYVKDETMLNFQLWAVSYEMVTALAKDIIAKLQLQGLVSMVTSTDLPIAYVEKGRRVNKNVNLTIKNNTNNTAGYLELKEKQNEGSVETVRQVPFTIAANTTSQLQLHVEDFYEASIYMYLNNKLVDLVYMADGSWNLDYDKNATTINQFTVLNETNPIINKDEHRLFRNASVIGTTKDYISLYKTINGGGIEQNLSEYKSIKFNAATTGVGNIKIIIIKKGIQNWSNQFSYTASISEKGEYAISLNEFKDAQGKAGLQATDVLGVNIALQNTRGSFSNITATISNLRFTKQEVVQEATAVKTVNIYPNPSKGIFTASFTSEVEETVVLRVIEVGSGRIVKTIFAATKKGVNLLPVNLDNKVSNGIYTVTLQSDHTNYQPQRLMISRN